MSDDLIAQAASEVQNLRRRSKTLAPSKFELEQNTPGSSSTVANKTADVPIAFRTGRHNPIKIAIPAYQSFETDGTGESQTFSLDHSLTDCPYTEDLVVWFGDDYVGSPDSANRGANYFEVEGPGEPVDVHAFYISDEPATVTLRKSMPSSGTVASEPLYDAALGLIQQTDLEEEPEWVSADSSPLHRFVAADMTVSIEVDAPYPVRFEADGAEATNALLSFPIQQGADTVPSLKAAVKADMGRR